MPGRERRLAVVAIALTASDDSEWSSGDYQEEPLETLQLQHQDRNHQDST